MFEHNRKIDENYSCAYCGTRDRPRPEKEYLVCPRCELPQFEGVGYDRITKFTRLDCLNCKRSVEPEDLIRFVPEEPGKPGGPVALIVWTCPRCKAQHYQNDDLFVLEAEIIEEEIWD